MGECIRSSRFMSCGHLTFTGCWGYLMSRYCAWIAIIVWQCVCVVKCFYTTQLKKNPNQRRLGLIRNGNANTWMTNKPILARSQCEASTPNPKQAPFRHIAFAFPQVSLVSSYTHLKVGVCVGREKTRFFSNSFRINGNSLRINAHSFRKNGSSFRKNGNSLRIAKC